ncbi:uncharacterized protein LOC123565800 [Mercenaria mercenaria]|uniref:uncharacterized protein LOC123565800 n=1 Tax=Mercenaria mercenaria TaxID=6596 RepID=UPI00234F05E4|nr:uncharacterized protein LOC123565800 [Mercenaria mercenaria]
MSICTVSNSSDISCDYGCCGTADNRVCCEFTLSDSIIIVICVVGALVVVAIVVALIICLTSKQKNRVMQIRPRQRRNMSENLEPRGRRVDIPKPPPYSEAPPQYDSLHVSDDSRSNPRSTDPILPGYTTSNTRGGARRQHASRRHNQQAEERRSNRTEPSDAPPSYISIIQVQSSDNANDRHHSPEPGTSGMGNNTVGRLSNNNATPLSVMDQTRNDSPHPSLASGRISMFNRQNENRSLHRTVSERSRQWSPHPAAGRRLLGKGNNSVTPVTIREISVHSHSIQNYSTGNGISTGKGTNIKRGNVQTKIPRPVKQKKTLQKDTNSNAVSNVTAGLLPGALEDENDLLGLGDSPPPMNTSAAARSAQRHTVLQRLQQRRHMISPPPVQ